MPNGVSRFCAPAFASSFPRKRESRFQVSQRLPWAPAFEAVTYFRTRALWRFARGQRRIPLFHAEKQQNTPVQARRRRNPALQVVDSAWIRREFRYGAEQRKFGGRSGELNDLTDELRRNLFVRRIFLTASFAGVTVALLCGAPPAPADTIYVSNEKDNTITVVDGTNLTPVKTIPVGQRPRGILLSKDDKSLYVCASDSDHIEELDLADDKVARTLPSGADPEYFALDPAGKLLYVANEDDNLVTVVDIERGEVVTEIPVGVEPEGMGISPDGKYLVNTSETTNMAHVIDTAKREVVANILVDSRPRRAVWTADGAQFWVSAEIGGTVSVIDAAKREIIKRITFAVPGVPTEAIQPVGIVISPDRKLAFVALGPANRVAVIDAQSYEVLRYLLVGQRVWSLAFNPDHSRVYTTNGVSNDISVIDVGSLKVIKSVPVGQSPWGVVSRP